jgi:hypothetical protein
MSDEKKITNTDEEIVTTEETIASNKEQKDNYEVGYGKPPKNTRFKKGVSGNPEGRPKKPLDFHRELLRKARSLITITDGERRVRITKLEGIALQVTNKALSGNNSSVKNFVGYYQEAVQAEALSAAQKAKELEKYDSPINFTTEELERHLAAVLKKKEEDQKK